MSKLCAKYGFFATMHVTVSFTVTKGHFKNAVEAFENDNSLQLAPDKEFSKIEIKMEDF